MDSGWRWAKRPGKNPKIKTPGQTPEKSLYQKMSELEKNENPETQEFAGNFSSGKLAGNF